MILLTVLYLVITALFAWMTISAIYHLRWVQRLPVNVSDRLEPSLNDGIQVLEKCSVVIAARDEESRIESTVRHLLAQQGVVLEIIVVNDRSVDQTGEILSKLSQQFAQVRAIKVEEVPNDWLGKCHACHIGASAATGDWILFTDADCWIKHDVIARALRVAKIEGVDHVTLTPGIEGHSIGTQAWHLAFLITLANWFSGVNRDRPKSYLGMGAFNLVRSSAYRNCGGYEDLKLTVLDDVRLGLLLRRAGFRTRAFVGGDDVVCHWGTTVGNMIRIMEKNYFAALDYRLAPAIIASLGGTLVWMFAIVGPFTGTVAGIAAGISMFSISIPAFLLSKRLGWGTACAIVTPLIFLCMFYAIFRSAWLTTWRRGVSWRGTHYSLESLRKGSVK